MIRQMKRLLQMLQNKWGRLQTIIPSVPVRRYQIKLSVYNDRFDEMVWYSVDRFVENLNQKLDDIQRCV